MEKFEKYVPLTGVLYVVLGLVGVAVAGDAPDFLPSPEEAQAYLVDDNGAALGSAVLWMLSAIPLLWFFGVLRSRMRAVEGPDDRLTWTGSTAAVGGVALLVAATGVQALGALRADEDGQIAGGLAQLLLDLSNILYGLAAPILFGVTLLAVGILALRRPGFLPSWAAWASVAFALVAFIPPISWVFMFFLLNLWVLVVAVLLYRSRPEPGGHTLQYTEVTQVTIDIDEQEEE